MDGLSMFGVWKYLYLFVMYFLQIIWAVLENPYVYLWNKGSVANVVPYLAGFCFSKLIQMVSLGHNVFIVYSLRFSLWTCVLKYTVFLPIEKVILFKIYSYWMLIWYWIKDLEAKWLLHIFCLTFISIVMSFSLSVTWEFSHSESV